jgi:hypothetical protein
MDLAPEVTLYEGPPPGLVRRRDHDRVEVPCPNPLRDHLGDVAGPRQADPNLEPVRAKLVRGLLDAISQDLPLDAVGLKPGVGKAQGRAVDLGHPEDRDLGVFGTGELRARSTSSGSGGPRDRHEQDPLGGSGKGRGAAFAAPRPNLVRRCT